MNLRVIHNFCIKFWTGMPDASDMNLRVIHNLVDAIPWRIRDASDMNLRVIHNPVHRRNDGHNNNQQCQ